MTCLKKIKIIHVLMKITQSCHKINFMCFTCEEVHIGQILKSAHALNAGVHIYTSLKTDAKIRSDQ